jgi:hypothetical protein
MNLISHIVKNHIDPSEYKIETFFFVVWIIFFQIGNGNEKEITSKMIQKVIDGDEELTKLFNHISRWG